MHTRKRDHNVVNDQIEMHKLKLVSTDATIFLTFLTQLRQMMSLKIHKISQFHAYYPCLIKSYKGLGSTCFSGHS